MEIIDILLIIVIVILLLFFLLLVGLATFAVFPKRYGMEETMRIELQKPYLKDANFEPKDQYIIKSFDNYELHGEILEFHPESKKYVIITHGYTYTRYGSYKYAYLFKKLGYNCVIYDDRGHGENKKARCMFGFREAKDLMAVIEDTYRRFGEDIYLGLHGESMGAGLSLMAMQYRPRVHFLVADCGYGRLMEVLCGQMEQIFHLPGKLAYPSSVVGRILYGYSFSKVNPVENLIENEIPICFIHGEADRFIPYHQSQEMNKVTKGYSELHLFPGAGHAGSLDSDIERYEFVMREFIKKVEENEVGENELP